MRRMGDRDSISSAASMNAKLADACSKEFFWGCELTKEKPSITWSFTEEDDDHDFLQHTLFLRHAILGKNVTSNEKQIVEIETKNFAGDDVKQPIFTLTEGRIEMCQLDLNFGHEIPVTFKLVEGSGPVFLSAQQLVEFPQEIEEDEFLTATETETEAEIAEDEEEDLEEYKKGRKRKANGSMAGKKKQRGKMDSDANGTEEDDEEDEEDEDEEDNDEESMETTEEDEEDLDDEDDDDEEEEEESPKKKGAKGKKGKAAAAGKAGKKAKGPVKAKKPAKKGKAK